MSKRSSKKLKAFRPRKIEDHSARYKILAFFLVIMLVALACDLPEGLPFIDPDQAQQEVSPKPAEEETAAPTEAAPTEAVETQQPVPRFEPTECFFPTTSPQIECGYLIVWQNRGTQDKLLSLAVTIIHGRANIVAPDPVLYLPDGPGQTAMEDVEARWLESPFLSKRDIVLLDPRGAGHSLPSLDCPELEGVTSREKYTAALACSARLQGEGLDLSLYDSANSAADIDDLRQVLDYDQFDLLGVGYGTRLALTVMRDYPAIVRSAMLDSLYPIEVNALNEYPQNVMSVVEKVFANCFADQACAQSYPDLALTLYEMVGALNFSPAQFETVDATGSVVRETMSGSDVMALTVEALSDSSLVPLVPRFWSQIGQGEYAAALATLGKISPDMVIEDQADDGQSPEGEDGTPVATEGVVTEEVTATEEVVATEEVAVTEEVEFGEAGGEGQSAWAVEPLVFSEGAYYSAICKEEAVFTAEEFSEELTDDYPRDVVQPLVDEIEITIAICADWGAGAAAEHENNAVQTNIPVLILSGEYDPLTPSAWAQNALPNFQQHFFFEFPGSGHALTADGTCALEIMHEFIDLPRTEPKAECLQGMPPFSFVPDENIELEGEIPPEELEVEPTPEPIVEGD